MNRDQIRSVVVSQLGTIAPELDAATIDPQADLREALDIDSMDFLRFVERLHEQLHVDVPESDYGRIVTLEGCVDYLASRVS